MFNTAALQHQPRRTPRWRRRRPPAHVQLLPRAVAEGTGILRAVAEGKDPYARQRRRFGGCRRFGAAAVDEGHWRLRSRAERSLLRTSRCYLRRRRLPHCRCRIFPSRYLLIHRPRVRDRLFVLPSRCLLIHRRGRNHPIWNRLVEPAAPALEVILKLLRDGIRCRCSRLWSLVAVRRCCRRALRRRCRWTQGRRCG